MKIIVLSEGARDIGSANDGPDQPEGALRVLTRRALSGFAGREVSREEVLQAPMFRSTQRVDSKSGGGLRRKVLRSLQLLATRTSRPDAVAIVVDSDKPGHDAGKLEKLRLGRGDAEKKGLPLAAHTALAVAIPEVEAWLIADHDLLTSKLGEKAGIAEPEKERDPKAKLESLLHGSGRSVRESYDWVANSLNLKNVRDRCDSFDKFCKELHDRVLPALRS